MNEFHSAGRAASATAAARRLAPVSPSDTLDLPHGPTRGVYVGEAGLIRVIDAAGGEVSLISAAAQYHPISVVRILAAGTTASGIVALY